jgi:hypothetical protein
LLAEWDEASVVRPLTFHILIYSSETTGPMEPNLAVSIYIRSSIKFLHFVPFHQQIDKLNMFSVYTQHLSLIVFEIKDEKY